MENNIYELQYAMDTFYFLVCVRWLCGWRLVSPCLSRV